MGRDRKQPAMPGGRSNGKRLSTDVVVGKDILELLSTAMYVDPLSVVREYVQNSIDAVDEAYASGVLTKPHIGRIDIELDPAGRSLRIRDNGVGITNRRAERTLCAFGNSAKRGRNQRGFRGVGRLGGLGFARSVTFRTKSESDPKVVQFQWDCRELRRLLLDFRFHEGLEDLVRRVVTVERYDSSDHSAHFFEVHMEGVVRIGQDRLLNPQVVEQYLRQVAPVPMSPDLRFGERIEEFLAMYLPGRKASIFLNGATEPLTRPHTDEFAVSSSRIDRFEDVEFLTLGGTNSEPAAVGWVLHHGYVGAIQATPELRGLRARAGDIQIGDSRIFSEVFPEQRFNSWVVGEFHVLDPRVLPNARRDDFEPNGPLFSLLSQLVLIGRDLSRRCRVSSRIRNRVKKFAFAEERAKVDLDIVEQAVIGKQAAAAMLREVAGRLEELGRVVGSDLFPGRLQKQLLRRLRRLVQRYSRLRGAPMPSRNDTLEALPRHKRVAYQEFVRILYDCTSNKRVAKLLVDRITARVAARKS